MLIIAMVLWVLARAERSAGPAVVAVLFTGAALLADLYDAENIVFSLGWNPIRRRRRGPCGAAELLFGAHRR